MRLIPAEWASVLRAIQEIDPGAIIAGGAIRDIDNGREPRDLDIFLSHDIVLSDVVATVRTGYVGLSGHWEYFSDPTVSEAICLDADEASDALDLNLIRVGEGITPIERVSHFDFGICQIAFDGRGLHKTTFYEADKRDELLYVRASKCQKHFDHTMSRYHRLSEKYPWPLVVPWQFRDFLKEHHNPGGSYDQEANPAV